MVQKFHLQLKRITRVVILSMAVVSCASPPQPRPQAMIDGATHLQQGIAAFKNDQYPAAAASFQQALQIYQSIDDIDGIINSRINLVESSIRMGRYPLAHEQLSQIEYLHHHESSSLDRTRKDLLRVRLHFNQGKHEQALKILQPLLPSFDAQNRVIEPDSNTLNLVSSRARLAVSQDQADADTWLTRFQVLVDQSADNDRYRALLYRLQARQRQRQSQLEDSLRLLQQALAIYHQRSLRSGIAATLQQMAEVEMQRDNWSTANFLLQRSLPVLLWSLNERGLKNSLQHLITVNGKLGNAGAVEKYRGQLRQLTEK